MGARVVVLHHRSAMRALISSALEEAGCTTIQVDDCRSLASDLRGMDPPDVIITDERAIAANPEAFMAARELFPRVVVVALAAPLSRRKPAPPALVDCELESPPRDDHLVRAVSWALELVRGATGTTRPTPPSARATP